MAQKSQRKAAEEVGVRTGRNPVVIAAFASVLLAWYQFYINGKKEHGLFIGLWPPTLLAFSNAMQINNISRKVESSAMTFLDRLMQS